MLFSLLTKTNLRIFHNRRNVFGLSKVMHSQGMLTSQNTLFFDRVIIIYVTCLAPYRSTIYSRKPAKTAFLPSSTGNGKIVLTTTILFTITVFPPLSIYNYQDRGQVRLNKRGCPAA